MFPVPERVTRWSAAPARSPRWAAWPWRDFQRLLPVADMAGGMCLEAMRGNTRGYDARLHALRPHPGQQETAQNLRRLLKGSEILARYRDHRVQDALSLRCIPQIHGAVRDQLAHCRQIMTIELNSVTDNPLFLVEEDRLIVMPGQRSRCANGAGAGCAGRCDCPVEHRFPCPLRPNNQYASQRAAGLSYLAGFGVLRDDDPTLRRRCAGGR